MGECSFPNCPSGLSQKYLDERHNELKSGIDQIKVGQVEMVSLMKQVAGQAADIQNIKELQKNNRQDHDIIFGRLRTIDKMTGGLAVIVAILEVLRAVKVL